jgi:hypothetical protein
LEAERSRAWAARTAINGIGAFLTAATTIIELVSKLVPHEAGAAVHEATRR